MSSMKSPVIDSSQIVGILMVVLFPKFGRPLDQHQIISETCSTDAKSEIAILDYSSKRLLVLNPWHSLSLFSVRSSSLFDGLDYGSSDTFLSFSV